MSGDVFSVTNSEQLRQASDARSRPADSALNVYARNLKLMLEDAERNLCRCDFEALCDILRIVGR